MSFMTSGDITTFKERPLAEKELGSKTLAIAATSSGQCGTIGTIN